MNNSRKGTARGARQRAATSTSPGSTGLQGQPVFNVSDWGPHFINVDLDIESATPLASLKKELGKQIVIMFSGRLRGRHCLFIEINAPHKILDETLLALCALIEGLSPKSRRLWDSAHRREFDIGFESRFSKHRANRFSIQPTTLRRIIGLGAGVAVTFYREETAEPGGRACQSATASRQNAGNLLECESN